ncbi:MAG TPA: hypothetical protein VIZ17_18735 [Acetobacteraceae bacterium]
MTRRPWLWLVCVAAAPLYVVAARAGETCQFAGATDESGQLAVTATSSINRDDGNLTLDIAGRFRDTPMPFVHLSYMMEEISTWRSGQLRLLAVNTRYLVDGHIVRQLWDLFQRTPDGGLQAFRVEAKTRDSLQRDHPAFTTHWDPASFGRPWVQDYWSARPDRRADLDLAAAAAGPKLRSPLALAFYWTRKLPPGGQTVTVFLPGFKRDKTADVTITATVPSSTQWQRWNTIVRHPALSRSSASAASAWVGTDGHLLQLAGTVRTRGRVGSGVIRQLGCSQTADPGPP